MTLDGVTVTRSSWAAWTPFASALRELCLTFFALFPDLAIRSDGAFSESWLSTTYGSSSRTERATSFGRADAPVADGLADTRFYQPDGRACMFERS